MLCEGEPEVEPESKSIYDHLVASDFLDDVEIILKGWKYFRKGPRKNYRPENKRPENANFHIICDQCQNINITSWCNDCDRQALIEKFGSWSTGNENLDLLIQESQRSATDYCQYLEFV